MNNNTIPKKVHYIWFGRGEKSDLIKSCIQKTQDLLDDWELVEWNEDNYDITKSAYVKEAYETGKYAFAADYARFDILYKHGGVYLDTDVELLKKIPDSFLQQEGFTGVEANQKIAPGLIFAVKPNDSVVREILDDYESDHYLFGEGKENKKTVVDRVTDIFTRHGFERNGKEQVIKNIHIYPSEYFCAYDFITREFEITDNTISIHHYTATWTDKKSKCKVKIQSIIRKIFGINNYKRLLTIKRKLFGVHGE